MTVIELNRVFAPIKSDTEQFDWGAELGRKYGGWLGWDELITHQRVVLLAEANSGKTEEFRLRVAVLRNRGDAAFFVRVEDLADGPLIHALTPDEETDFNTWRDGQAPGWFFLDSVDEARLNHKRLDQALTRFRRDVGVALARASVFVSSRASDWRGKQDLDFIRDTLPVPSRENVEPSSPDVLLLGPIFEESTPPVNGGDIKNPHEPITIVRLAELFPEQRSALARSAGVTDTNPFLREINRHGLETLAERPGDLLELAAYWNEHGRFASLAEMTESGITRKLAERDAHRRDAGSLTEIRAREGAERVAAALMLGKSLTLRVPDQDADPTLTADALDPAAILPDWTPSDRLALLRRGVFTPATYGRVRFHHRSTQEYLTAEWLRRMLGSGCPRSEIMRLMFADPYGVRTAVPSMRPAAAWLALHDNEVRNELAAREPLVLLQYGDPASLPLSTRARLLIAYADRHAAGQVTDDNWDRRPFWMFADRRLANAIREAWKRNTDPSFRADLLLLVREGEITDCLDLARQAALATDLDVYVRSRAVSTMTACGDRDGLAQFQIALMSNPSAMAEQDAAQFALRLFPAHLSRSQLVRLINESQAATPNSGEGFPSYVRELWDRCPKGERAAFLEELADLCLTPPFPSEHYRVSSKHRRLARELAALAADLAVTLGDETVPQGLIKACAAIERSQERADQNDVRTLREALGTRRDFHRQLFWFDVQEARRNRGGDVTHWWDLALHGERLWEFSQEDAEWLLSRVRDEPAVQDRQLALNILSIVLGEGGLRARGQELRVLVAGIPELENDLSAALTPPRPHPELEELKESERLAEREQAEREAEDRQSWLDFAARLRSDSSHLRDPAKIVDWQHSRDLYTLTEWLRRSTEASWDEAARKWRYLAEVFGDDVAQAYRVGMKLIWRQTAPRGENAVGRDSDEIVGTTHLLSFLGVGLESEEDEAWACHLTAQEAERAMLHAVSAREPSPNWVEALVRAHPDRVKPIITRKVEAEWASSSASRSDFLYGIATGGDEYLSQMADLVVELLQRRPASLERYDKALCAFARLPKPRSEPVALVASAKRAVQANPADHEWVLRQLGFLFTCNPDIAVQSLERWIAKAKSEPDRKLRSKKAFARLFSRHSWPLAPGALKDQPVSTLKRLTSLAYRSVRVQDDEHHRGMYSPGTRDEAQSARSRILEALLEIPGRETYEAIRDLADEPSIAPRAKRFRELAHRRAEQDAERPAWFPRDVVAFEQRQVSPAKTGADLFRMACSVLDDIQTDFRHGDASSRRVLQSAEDEEAVQQWLAEQFKLRSKDRYHVHREVEVADKKEPDILLSSTAAPFEVAVEVKHGGKGWSIRDLEKAVREQLAGQYLRSTKRRHGILVITHHPKRTRHDPDTKRKVTFEQLVTRLRALAGGLRSNETGAIEVAVIGIDSTLPG
jgi:hypothetical protein